MKGETGSGDKDFETGSKKWLEIGSSIVCGGNNRGGKCAPNEFRILLSYSRYPTFQVP
jgi:hypothetical protein